MTKAEFLPAPGGECTEQFISVLESCRNVTFRKSQVLRGVTSMPTTVAWLLWQNWMSFYLHKGQQSPQGCDWTAVPCQVPGAQHTSWG